MGCGEWEVVGVGGNGRLPMQSVLVIAWQRSIIPFYLCLYLSSFKGKDAAND